jgi:hypothetical protein
MIKKINLRLLFIKWLIISLSVVINILALFNWIDVFFFGIPSDSTDFLFLITNTLIGLMLIHVCYNNKDFNIYDHFIGSSDHKKHKP